MSDDPAAPDIDLVIDPRPREVGDMIVGRLLPVAKRRHVGPFVFFDEMGPAELAEGRTVDVRPHPHIGLATVTYLFDGELVHRDSLGTEQAIRPGAVNWMTAGSGIVHSERSRPAGPGARLHGIQLWCGLPRAVEETAPTFEHYPADTLPSTTVDGLTIRVLAGEAFGMRSPVKTHSRLFYVDVQATVATTITAPAYPERAAYAVRGELAYGDQTFKRGHMLVFTEGRTIELSLAAGTRVMLLGGEPLDGERHIYWNFVSSSPERIARAAADWKAQRFPKILGDDQEFTPIPE